MPPPNSSENEIKRRARRRLIGAVALTLLAVIVLPLLLEDEPPPSSSLAVRMATLPEPESEPAAPAQAAAVTPDDPAPAMPALPPPEPAMPAASAAQPEPAAPAPVKPEAAKVMPPKPKPSVPALVTVAAPAPQSKADTASEVFVVQLAALADAAKAGALKARAAQAGLPAYTDTVGRLTRVRVGPYPSREAAVAAAVKLAENGMNGQVLVK